jgi:two-component system chemotaxis response regulator CheY
MRRILVIDDSATMRSLYKQLLAHVKNTTVHFAHDGRQGVEMYASVEPHIAFLDINMPNMNGLEVLAELTRTGLITRAPIVMVTTEGSEKDIARGLAAGASAYLPKPFKLTSIREVIEKLAPISESITMRAAPGAAGGGAS